MSAGELLFDIPADIDDEFIVERPKRNVKPEPGAQDEDNASEVGFFYHGEPRPAGAQTWDLISIAERSPEQLACLELFEKWKKRWSVQIPFYSDELPRKGVDYRAQRRRARQLKADDKARTSKRRLAEDEPRRLKLFEELTAHLAQPMRDALRYAQEHGKVSGKEVSRMFDVSFGAFRAAKHDLQNKRDEDGIEKVEW